MVKNSNRFITLSLLLSAAYFLSACGGTLPQRTSAQKAPNVQAKVVAFTGIVEAINGSQWTVSGQQVTVDPQASLAPNITVGGRVKVEANVSSDGALVALKVDSSANNDMISSPSADARYTPASPGTSIPAASVAPALGSTPNPSVTQVAGNNENGIFGTVEAVGVDTVTVNGVTYIVAGFTEIKDAIAVGDQVKLHVILNADGTLTIREIEKRNDNGNSNDSNDNSNDDDSADNSNDDSDDEPDHDSNENESGSGGTNDSGGG